MTSRWKFEIKAQADGGAIDLAIYDVVGGGYYSDCPSAKEVLDQLAANKNAKQINIRVNSVGGDVYEGLAMYNVLGDHKAKKVVQVDGLAASIASIICMAGDEIIMPENAMMMIHNPWSWAVGDATDMRKTADFLDKMRTQLVGIYSARTGQKSDDVAKAMDDETWMTAAEAKELGYATTVTPSKKAAAMARVGLGFDPKALAKAPKAAIALAAELRASSDVVTEAAVEAKAVTYNEYPAHDDSSWDGSAAEDRMRKWASSDGSGDKDKMDWAKYRNGFAWYDDKNPSSFGAYKLPHHDVVNDELVTSRHGVMAAGNAVSGSRGGTDIPDDELAGVRAHLEKSYHQFDMKAPWEHDEEKTEAHASWGNVASLPMSFTADELKAALRRPRSEASSAIVRHVANYHHEAGALAPWETDVSASAGKYELTAEEAAIVAAHRAANAPPPPPPPPAMSVAATRTRTTPLAAATGRSLSR